MCVCEHMCVLRSSIQFSFTPNPSITELWELLIPLLCFSVPQRLEMGWDALISRHTSTDDLDLLPSGISKWTLFSILKYATLQRLQVTRIKCSSIHLPLQALGNGKESMPYSLFSGMFSQWPLRPHFWAAPEKTLRSYLSTTHSVSLSRVPFSFYSQFSWRLPYLALGRGRDPSWPQSNWKETFFIDMDFTKGCLSPVPDSVLFLILPRAVQG